MALTLRQKIVFLAILFYATFAWANAAHAAITKPANNLGLVGYWSFNEGAGTRAGDHSGNDRHGTLVGDTTWIQGRISSALSFDGAGDYMQAGSNSVFSIPGDITLSAWIYPHALSVQRGIVTHRDSNVSSDWVFMTTGGGLIFNYHNGSGWFSTGCSAGMALNRWHHVAVVRNIEDNKVYYYLNGVLRCSVDGIGSGLAHSDPVRIGTDPGWNDFDGEIDEVRVYRRALSGSEIRTLYANVSIGKFSSARSLGAGTTLENGLVGYWTMDGVDITDQVYDRVGGFNGYFVGGATSTAKAPGKLGQAARFDGGNDRIEIGDTGANAETISLWFKPATVITTGTTNTFLMALNTSGSAQQAIGLGSVTANLTNELITVMSNTTATGDRSGYCVAGGSINTQWHHLVIRWVSSNNTFDIYLDGVKVDNCDSNPSENLQASRVWIGGSDDTGTAGFFPGSIDDVRIYNRSISNAEIRKLYQLGAGKMNASAETLQSGTGLGTGLLGYWSFDGADFTTSVLDKSGQGNHGYLSNGTPTSTAKTQGKLGQGLHLDGSDDSVFVPHASSLNPGTGDFAIAAWVKSSNMESGDSIMLKTNGGGEHSAYGFHYGVFGTRQPTMHISTGGSFTQIQSASSLTSGVWNHVLITVDRDNMSNTKVYINGEETSTNVTNPTANTGSISNTVPVAIGSESDGGFNWDGQIDEVRYYGRTLSAAEAKMLYQLGR